MAGSLAQKPTTGPGNRCWTNTSRSRSQKLRGESRVGIMVARKALGWLQQGLGRIRTPISCPFLRGRGDYACRSFVFTVRRAS